MNVLGPILLLSVLYPPSIQGYLYGGGISRNGYTLTGDPDRGDRGIDRMLRRKRNPEIGKLLCFNSILKLDPILTKSPTPS